jgi:surface antigen
MKSVSLLFLCIALVGCNQHTSQRAGQIIGGGGGSVGAYAVAGNSVAGRVFATAAGGALGALVGGEIAKSLTATDRQVIEDTSLRALNGSGDTIEHGRNTGTGLEVTATATEEAPSSGDQCRRMALDVATPEGAYSGGDLYCLNAAGEWELANA